MNSCLRRRRAVGGVAAAAVALLIAGCGKDSAQQPIAPTPPLVVINTPPTISEVRPGSERVEANQEVEVVGLVRDAETALDKLAYSWSASPVAGTFIGNGARIRWRAPQGQKSPDTYALTITVTEDYTSAGQPQRNTVSASAPVHYNDSVAEITRIGVRFLTELFPTFSVTPEEAVQDFSDSCPGKKDERDDVTGNRKNFHILSGTYTDISVDLDTPKTFATARGTCVFRDIPNGGSPQAVHGICTLTAVYENWRWFLCESHFASTGPNTPGSLRYRVPGSTKLRAP